ncbi:transposase [Croceifilum oryzae]|uniref:Transposase n=1 Tax=Croceifilum oryzae TaxID=1553429 RepID=A0AAJ1TMU4_9BACL|nr:IS5 family transposase [Croceifilum oryzae]MDQ0417600.1 transposase [Croceifilum oryzae]
MSRHNLTEQQWQLIEPLLPKRKSYMGRPPVDNRKVMNGIIYILRTGSAWADLPKEYGSPTTCWRRLRDWQKVGIWERIWRKVLQSLHQKKKINLDCVYLDGSFVRSVKGGNEIGKTKVGKGSKLMMVADQSGLPIGLHLSSAQPHEVRLAKKTLATTYTQ